MTDKTRIRDEREIAIRIPADTYLDLATCCYECCGHASPEAVSKMASLILHHTWHELETRQRWPYWMSSVFDEVDELGDLSESR